jgi:hypothetical protein
LAFGVEIPFSVSAAKVVEPSNPEMGARARERAKWRSKFFIAVASIEDRREWFRSGLGKIRGERLGFYFRNASAVPFIKIGCLAPSN